MYVNTREDSDGGAPSTPYNIGGGRTPHQCPASGSHTASRSHTAMEFMLTGAIPMTHINKGLCTTLLDRLQGDQVLTPLESLAEFDQRPGKLAIAYMNHKLGIKK